TIARFLERYVASAQTTVVGSAEDALRYLEALAKQDDDGNNLPDLVLVDVSLPGISGIELVGKSNVAYPGLLCLMLSGHKEPAYVQRSLELGARGYVAKGNPPAIVEGVRRVLDGELYLSDDVAP